MFDSTIGARTVYMPFGGRYQLTPAISMAAKICGGETDVATVAAYGYSPELMSTSPFTGAVYSLSLIHIYIPRIFPEGIGCEIDKNSYEVPPVFRVMQERAGITDAQIYNTFNMGVGMVVCVAQKDAQETVKLLRASGEKAFVLGKTVAGKGVTLL